jgi:O-acetyl-ADP-ribose deacetylase (regulator of RNase III)
MLLASAVRAALKRADEVGARSVALPAISAGVYGFPLARAADLSIGAARSFAAEARKRLAHRSSASSTTAPSPRSSGRSRKDEAIFLKLYQS